jgi:TfoX/Sxy family transcriptional regulator of competence genes
MAHNEKLTARVRGAQAGVSKVEEKIMFRGVLFMVEGKMCLSTGDDELMCRIDHVLHDSLIQKPGVRTLEMKGKPYIGYIKVKEEVLKTKKQLDYWVGLALEFNKKAKASPKKKKISK